MSDVETLRLLYEDALGRMEAARERRRSLHAEFAALPTVAGAIVALFFTARPEGLPNVFGVLYGLGVVVFIFLLYMCLGARNELDAPEIQGKIAAEAKVSDTLSDEDRLPVEEWLTQAVVAWRAAAVAGTWHDTPFVLYLRRARIMFGVLVVYFSAVAVAALIVGTDGGNS